MQYIQIGDDDYISSITNTTNWYDGVFIALFAQSTAHYAHITYDERHSTLPQRVNLPILIHVMYLKQTLLEGQYKPLPPGVTRVVAVLHEAAHYAVLEIAIHDKKVYVYDGLYRDLNRRLDYVFSAIKHCMMCDLEAAHLCEADKPKSMKVGGSRHARMSIEGYKLRVGIHEWRFEREHFVKEVDSFNCGPIASCTKILEMFHLTSTYEVKLAYDTNGIRNLVMEHWRRFVHRCEQDLLVPVRECLLLCTPTAEEGNLMLPLQNTASTAPISDPVIAAAAAASAQAEIDHHQLCFCYCDLPDMELVRRKCCKQTIHRRCLLAYLGINSQCAYCCGAAINIAVVLALPTIDRSAIIFTTMSPPQRTPTVRRDLQSFFLDKTPLRLADKLWTALQEKSVRANVSRQLRRLKCRARIL
jgi:hypothetical protein